MNKTYIYGLASPIDFRVRYVGKAKNPLVRFNQHLGDARKNRPSAKAQWIKSLLDENQSPTMVILELCEDADSDTQERYWIRYFSAQNIDLTNHKNNHEFLVNFSLRLPRDIYNWLREEAERRCCSVNTLMVAMLRSHKENHLQGWRESYPVDVVNKST